MSWTCYSCETKNPNSADACSKCGGNVAAPSNFYLQWVFGGAAFFFVTYLAGVFIGGTLVEFKVSPSDPEIFAMAKTQGAEVGSVMELKPDQAKAAKATLVAKAKAEMSPFMMYFTYWFISFLLFIVCGAIVGFVSDGRTVIEAGLGSVIGQISGFLVLVYGLETEMSWAALIVGLVIGAGLAILGAWLGEAIQERRERVGG